MTTQQAIELFLAEKNGKLRLPKNMLTTNKVKQDYINDLFYFISISMAKDSSKLLKNAGVGFEIEISIIDEMRMQDIAKTNPYLQGFKMGDDSRPFSLNTDFGYGEFYNARRYFKNLTYPKGIVKGYCHRNCQLLAASFAEKFNNVKRITGICFVGHQFLHSVLYFEQNGKKLIMDVNHDLVMDADFYFKLTSFEKLTETSGNQILYDMKEIFIYNPKFDFNLPDICFALAYDDVMQKIKQVLKDDGELY